MYARLRVFIFSVVLAGQVVVPAAICNESGQITGISSFLSKVATTFTSQWKQETASLEPVYQQCPLHWHVGNIAYLSMGVITAFTFYKTLKWGLNKIGMLKA